MAKENGSRLGEAAFRVKGETFVFMSDGADGLIDEGFRVVAPKRVVAALPEPPTAMTIVDHMGIAVTDVERGKAFYSNALAPLGISILMEGHGWIGMGKDRKPEFWFGGPGRDNGPPGIREIYHPHYYGAFVLGPDGHNIEAVCHRPE